MRAAHDRERARLLFSELRWLMRLRWGASAAMLGAAGVQWAAVGDRSQAARFLALGVAAGLANAVFCRLAREPGLRLRWARLLALASVQVYLDLASITLLVMWTGGVSSPLMGLYVFHMLFASLLQPRRLAYVAASVATGLLAVGLWWSGQWPRETAAASTALGWIGTLLVTVFLADQIARELYRRGLARLRQIRRIHALASRLRAHQRTMVQHEKMVAMGRLAAGIAHEINNPLASMDSVLQLMQRNPASARPDSVAALREQVQRIHKTVRELTAFAHPGRGTLERVNVNDVVRAALSMLALDGRLAKARPELDLLEGDGTVCLNPQAMQQVLTNLILNALDACAAVHEPRLVIRTVRDGGDCSISVSDNGTGIAAENLDRVFEPFFTTKPIGQGTGLGLSISSNLVREQGGRIEVASEPGRGTTFTVILPVEPIPAAPEAATGARARRSAPVLGARTGDDVGK